MQESPAGTANAFDPSSWHALSWRLVGPFRGGRVVAVTGHPTDYSTFYIGSSGGGIWKTNDGGTTWLNVSDGYFKRASVGAIAVSDADPNVIYAGMGESHIRGNVSHGDGVYKSTDGGKSWTHLGLADTYNIARVRVDPRDPDLVYVAALGHAHGPNRERGIFRSKDGGKTWEHVLFHTDKAGAIDLSLDPTNPRVLYTTFWEAIRRPHELVSGGPDSAIFRSTDGGDTWQDITHNPGLPKGILGKCTISAAPKAGRVYALLEAEDGALFRSDDGGDTWQRRCEEPVLRERPWYFNHLYADPADPDTVWVMSFIFHKSIDGGQTFSVMPTPHADNHDLWVDARHPQRMIIGNDGGASVSLNGGETWSSVMNQPTVEFYHVTTDNQIPYRIYGAQQDNSTISVPSRSRLAAITQADWYEIGGGESGYIQVDPRNPNIVYAGSYGGVLTRYDHATGQRQTINVWPELSPGHAAREVKYRFQWTYPILLSPHDPSTLYVTSNHVHRSTDEGMSWEVISPDLTRNDPEKQGPSAGPITFDNTGAEYYDTIFAFAESPVTQGVFWAGSDDGLVHVSRDNGQSWQNVTPPDLPPWALISIIEPSPHDAATAYVAANRYKVDDFSPYLYKTNDYGQTWTKIVDGIPSNDFTRAIREDPVRRGLLYAGTETGLNVSFDDGAHWQRFQANLPVVPIHDLVVKETDLILATHGRSFWVLDDITPLRELTDEVANSDARLFAPRPTYKFGTQRGFGRSTAPGTNYQGMGASMAMYRMEPGSNGEQRQRWVDAGQNPPDGVMVSYYLKAKPEQPITLSFLDGKGNEIKRFTSQAAQDAAKNGANEPTVPVEPGINRFVWNMRYPGAVTVPGAMFRGGGNLEGPVAPPGTYQVRLTVGDQTFTQPFEIRKDPRVPASQADLEAQFNLLMQIRDKLSETHEAINRLRKARERAEIWRKRAEEDDKQEVAQQAQQLIDSLLAVERELIESRLRVSKDPLRFPPKPNAKLVALMGNVGGADAAPTRQSREVFETLSAQIEQQLERLPGVLESEVERFNALVRQSGLAPVE